MIGQFADTRVRLGLPVDQLWGVSNGPPKRNRGEAAQTRRQAKKAAKAKNMPLKAYLKTQTK